MASPLERYLADSLRIPQLPQQRPSSTYLAHSSRDPQEILDRISYSMSAVSPGERNGSGSNKAERMAGRASYSEVNHLNEDEQEILNRIATRVSARFVSHETPRADVRNSKPVAPPAQAGQNHANAPLKMDKSTSSDDMEVGADKLVEDNSSIMEENKLLRREYAELYEISERLKSERLSQDENLRKTVNAMNLKYSSLQSQYSYSLAEIESLKEHSIKMEMIAQQKIQDVDSQRKVAVRYCESLESSLLDEKKKLQVAILTNEKLRRQLLEVSKKDIIPPVDADYDDDTSNLVKRLSNSKKTLLDGAEPGNPTEGEGTRRSSANLSAARENDADDATASDKRMMSVIHEQAMIIQQLRNELALSTRVENPLLDLDPLEVLRVSLNISLAPDSGLERQERALALVKQAVESQTGWILAPALAEMASEAFGHSAAEVD
ncbi:hypothetical protein GUITHDRAFT_115734 [Guillardia theta CCMP2712]|uniref:Uncharacterized protein n=1 Tax=Guillardia theta (strain CCMP2712) TaxID=905079 RepID=L1IQU3_GUITC|nr:hypothetical protein GUITHDRAFT_115734 [Guillardia theta CCMP2712]EKX38190.1 hypothetical protein GUITHDRAFT_115734 [Guillardia theta CCMP2712]|eukprot:XP_005825170.1 hypothetical protein GUITHDRAFT_115734 [Guillardia theta CCMP2712]